MISVLPSAVLLLFYAEILNSLLTDVVCNQFRQVFFHLRLRYG